MKILLTGGTGYIGSHTAIELIKEGHEIEILDNLYNSKITVLDKIEEIAGIKPKFYEVDMLIRDIEIQVILVRMLCIVGQYLILPLHRVRYQDLPILYLTVIFEYV